MALTEFLVINFSLRNGYCSAETSLISLFHWPGKKVLSIFSLLFASIPISCTVAIPCGSVSGNSCPSQCICFHAFDGPNLGETTSPILSIVGTKYELFNLSYKPALSLDCGLNDRESSFLNTKLK